MGSFVLSIKAGLDSGFNMFIHTHHCQSASVENEALQFHSTGSRAPTRRSYARCQVSRGEGCRCAQMGWTEYQFAEPLKAPRYICLVTFGFVRAFVRSFRVSFQGQGAARAGSWACRRFRSFGSRRLGCSRERQENCRLFTDQSNLELLEREAECLDV